MPDPKHGGHQGPLLPIPIPPHLLAVALAENGFACFPCNGKKPLVKWTQYQTNPPTLEQVKSWWEKHPTANVAIVTGNLNRLTVVDVDGCGHSPETLRRLLELFGPTPIVVATPGKGGGYQLYYRHTLGERNGAWEESGFHGDIRGQGGYVMAPGSLHPDTRTHYHTECTPEDFVTALAYLPAYSHKPAQNSPDKSDFLPTEGNRNNTLFKNALICAAKHDTKEQYLAAVEALNDTFPKPLEAEEVQRTANNAWSYKERGTLVTEREPHATITKSEWQLLHPDEFYFLAFLRMGSGHRNEFAIGQLAVSKILHWSTGKVRRNIRGLISAGFIHQRHKGGSTKGDASLYGWGADRGTK